MAWLARTYSALGRHSDALAMEESVLEFRPRHTQQRGLRAAEPDGVWGAGAVDGGAAESAGGGV